MADIPVTVKFRVSNAKGIKNSQKSINALQKRISEMNKKMSAMTKQLNAGSKAFNRMNTSMNKTAKGAKNVGNRVGTMTKKVKKGKRSMEEFGASGIVTGLVFATLGAQAGQFGRQITDAMTSAVTSTAKLFGELQRVSAFSNNVFLPSGKIDYKAANEIKNLVFRSGLDTGVPFLDVATIYKEVEKGVPDNVDSKAFAKRIVELTLLENNLNPEKITADVITLASNFNLQIDEALDVITAFSKSTKLNLGAGSKAFGFAAGAAKRLGGTAQDLAKVLASIANQIPGFQGNAGRGLGNLLNNLTKPGVTDALADIGVNILDAEGNSIGLIKTLDLLAETYSNFENISDEARNVFLSKVINSSLNATRALEAYVDTTVEERAAIQETVDNSAGLTARLITAQKDTAEANLGKIKNQVDLLKISFSAGLFPAIKEVNQILTTLVADKEFLGFIQDFGKAIGDEFVSLIRAFIKDLQNFKGVLLGLKPLLPIIAKAIIGVVTSLHAFGVIGPVIGIAFGLSFAMKALSGSLLGSSGLAVALRATSISFARFIGIIALAGLVVFSISKVISSLTSTAEDAASPLETVAYALTAIGGATGILLLSGQLGNAVALATKLKSTLLGLPVVTAAGSTGNAIKTPIIPTGFLTDFKTKVGNVFKSLSNGVAKFGNAIIAIPGKIKGVGNSIRNSLFGTAGGQAGFFSTTGIKKFVTDVKTIPSKIRGVSSAIHGAIFGTTAAIGQASGAFIGKIGTAIRGIGRGHIVAAAVIAGAVIITAFFAEMNKRVEESEFFKTGFADKWEQVGFQSIAATNVFLRELWKLWVDFVFAIKGIITDVVGFIGTALNGVLQGLLIAFQTGDFSQITKSIQRALKEAFENSDVAQTLSSVFDQSGFTGALDQIESRLNDFPRHINPLATDLVKNSIEDVLTAFKVDYSQIHQSGLQELLTNRFGGLGNNLYNQITNDIREELNTSYKGTQGNIINGSGKVDYNTLQNNFETAVADQIIAVEGTEEDITAFGDANADATSRYDQITEKLLTTTNEVVNVNTSLNNLATQSDNFADQLKSSYVSPISPDFPNKDVTTTNESSVLDTIIDKVIKTNAIASAIGAVFQTSLDGKATAPVRTDDPLAAYLQYRNYVPGDPLIGRADGSQEGQNASALSESLYGVTGGLSGRQIYEQQQIEDAQAALESATKTSDGLNTSTDKLTTKADLFTKSVNTTLETTNILTDSINKNILQVDTFTNSVESGMISTDTFTKSVNENIIKINSFTENISTALSSIGILTTSLDDNNEKILAFTVKINTVTESTSKVDTALISMQNAIESAITKIKNIKVPSLFPSEAGLTGNINANGSSGGGGSGGSSFISRFEKVQSDSADREKAASDAVHSTAVAVIAQARRDQNEDRLRNSSSNSSPTTNESVSHTGFRGRSSFFAEGGIVTRATRAIIGERGPEAVIPLRELSGILHKSIDNNNSNNKKENNIVINFNPTINVNGNENVGETVKAELEVIVENVLVSKLRSLAQ